MIEIKVKVEVDLSERTAALVQPNKRLEDLPCDGCNCNPMQEDLKTFVKETVYEFLRDLQDHAKKPVEEPKPETAQSPIPEEKPAPAPQQDPAPAPEKEITDADLRQAVKAAKDKVGTPVVKALFAEFEIPNSSACPQERRSELMDRLEKLAA